MNFRGIINLMALKGAKCLTVKTEDGKTQSGVFIPAAYNDMLRENNGRYEVSPYINIRVWAASQNFINAYIRRRAGENNVVPPTHTINISFSQEFEQRAIASASKRIEAERKASNLPELSSDELEKAARYAVGLMLGTLTPIESRQAGYQASQVVQASDIDFNTPGNQASDDQQGFEAPIDDLPF